MWLALPFLMLVGAVVPVPVVAGEAPDFAPLCCRDLSTTGAGLGEAPDFAPLCCRDRKVFFVAIPLYKAAIWRGGAAGGMVFRSAARTPDLPRMSPG